MRRGVEAPWWSGAAQERSEATMTVEHKDSPFVDELCVYGGGRGVCNGKFFRPPFSKLDDNVKSEELGQIAFYFHADNEVFLAEGCSDGQKICVIVEGDDEPTYFGIGSASECAFFAQDPEVAPPPRVVQVNW